MKEKDLQFIKDFSKINISSICKKLNIDRANLLKNRTSYDKVILVKNEIIKEFEKIKKSLEG